MGAKNSHEQSPSYVIEVYRTIFAQGVAMPPIRQLIASDKILFKMRAQIAQGFPKFSIYEFRRAIKCEQFQQYICARIRRELTAVAYKLAGAEIEYATNYEDMSAETARASLDAQFAPFMAPYSANAVGSEATTASSISDIVNNCIYYENFEVIAEMNLHIFTELFGFACAREPEEIIAARIISDAHKLASSGDPQILQDMLHKYWLRFAARGATSFEKIRINCAIVQSAAARRWIAEYFIALAEDKKIINVFIQLA